MTGKTVAVIFGSRSAEHDVSIITALASIIKPLELTKRFNVMPVYIAKDGRWFSDPKLKDIKFFSSGKIDRFIAKTKPVAVQFSGGFTLIKPGLKNQTTKIDIVFPATHGTHGEDGELMGLLEMAKVPYVGCDVPASVVAMDKVLAKQIAGANDIPTPKYEYLMADTFAKEPQAVLDDIEKALSYPLFIKPAHLGSSIGITRAKNRHELNNAIEVACHYDPKVLVEEEVPNLIEVTLPVMGNKELMPAMLEQPLTSAEDFFDFETKYMKGGKKNGAKSGAKQGAQGYSQIPADIPEPLYKKAVAVGLEVYRALGCSGIARVDMLIDKKAKKVYFNEVNPLPGSLYSHNWNKSGISNVQLVSMLITLAEERHSEKQKYTTTFDTNYLKQF